MCGLVGYFSLDGTKSSQSLIEKMTSLLAHRGPDGEGIYVHQALAFGHRHLKVIDLTTGGAQPMTTTDGRYTLVYNGEIYNFRELRQELIKEGILFFSDSDTEVVLNMLVFKGRESVKTFNGMFAFAFYDAKEECLLIGRDRYGIKPLYTTLSKGTFLFASEIKALTPHPSFHYKISEKGLIEYLTFQNFLREKTLFEGISLLPAGSTLEIRDRKIGPVISYWDFNFSDRLQIDKKEAGEEIQRLLNQAVKRQLVGEVPIGCYLSGGIDSSAIVASASQEIDSLNTFTIGFEDETLDERGEAEELSKFFGTKHRSEVLKDHHIEEVLSSLCHHLEEPRVGQSYPNFYAAKLASKHVTVTLSGTGGDELFGGYPWRYTNDEQFLSKGFQTWRRLIPIEQEDTFFSPIKKHFNREELKKLFSSFAQSKNSSFYFEAKTFLQGILIVEDKLGMAHGVETRLPFLDNDLVDFAMHLPTEFKLDDRRDNHGGKMILRKTFDSFLPKQTVMRKKQGFTGPDGEWFRKDRTGFIKRHLDDSILYAWIDKKTVQTLIDEHQSGRGHHRLLIWSLLVLDETLRQTL